jgi:hypothetical protein
VVEDAKEVEDASAVRSEAWSQGIAPKCFKAALAAERRMLNTGCTSATFLEKKNMPMIGRQETYVDTHTERGGTERLSKIKSR